jgi:transcriptional regulator with XRE-family HTH domain
VKHVGEIIEKAIRSSGFPITKLAQKMGVSRQYIYNLFENPKVDAETLSIISSIIRIDLTSEAGYATNIQKNELSDCKNELLELSKKYIRLLEEHQKLLELHKLK